MLFHFPALLGIHSIHRGIDVAIKTNTLHIAACTGSVSEKAAKKEYNLHPQSMIDMGDFVGGMLKYLKRILCQELQSQEALQNY